MSPEHVLVGSLDRAQTLAFGFPHGLAHVTRHDFFPPLLDGLLQTEVSKLLTVSYLQPSEGRSLVFGRRLLSQPFSEYGGFLLDQDLRPEERRAIVDAVLRFLEFEGFAVLETHGNYGMGAPDAKHGRTPTILPADLNVRYLGL